MLRYLILISFFLTQTAFSVFAGGISFCQDTLRDNQELHNGRIWRNLYFLKEGDQFLFSKRFLQGTVAINGKFFPNVPLKYDIFKDEILTPVDTGGILQLNKELVDSFSLIFQDRKYHFIRMKDDSVKASKKYLNLLYKGKSALCIKYIKKIDHPVDGENDRFYQFSKVYFVKDDMAYLIAGKRDLLKILVKEKDLIKTFIRNNNIYLSDKDPESFIPVIKYYDSLVN
jgi:hypothetical protein